MKLEPEPPEATGRLLHTPREVALPGAAVRGREASATAPII
jgi:hypothetical protein